MSRSVWKGPYVHPSLFKAVEKHNKGEKKGVIKTFCRSSAILPSFIDKTFGVHNGRTHVPIRISEHMVGHKFGEFAPTRTFRGHAGDKQARKKGG